MVIKQTPKGNIVYVNDKAMVAFKDKTYKIIHIPAIFYDVTPELGREIVKAAIKSKNLEQLRAEIDEIGYQYVFEYSLGLGRWPSHLKFESDFMRF